MQIKVGFTNPAHITAHKPGLKSRTIFPCTLCPSSSVSYRWRAKLVFYISDILATLLGSSRSHRITWVQPCRYILSSKSCQKAIISHQIIRRKTTQFDNHLFMAWLITYTPLSDHYWLCFFSNEISTIMILLVTSFHFFFSLMTRFGRSGIGLKYKIQITLTLTVSTGRVNFFKILFIEALIFNYHIMAF
jgi:hypothetical protein